MVYGTEIDLSFFGVEPIGSSLSFGGIADDCVGLR
jgi:hypothetical protein